MYNKQIAAQNKKIQARVREMVEALKFKRVISKTTRQYSRETQAAIKQIERDIATEFSHIPKDRLGRNVLRVLRSYKPEIK